MRAKGVDTAGGLAATQGLARQSRWPVPVPVSHLYDETRLDEVLAGSAS